MPAAAGATPVERGRPVNITQSDTHLTISLSRWEKLASLHGDLDIPLQDVTAASVDPHPTKSVFGKLKRGLRIPGYAYLATAEHGDHFIAVRRGAGTASPGARDAVRGDGQHARRRAHRREPHR